MKNFYQTTKGYLARPLAYLVLGGLALVGCDDPKSSPIQSPQIPKKDLSDYTFEDFGVVFSLNEWINGNADIELGDIDGDQDLDIIIADKSDGIIRILENRIQQKNIKAEREK